MALSYLQCTVLQNSSKTVTGAEAHYDDTNGEGVLRKHLSFFKLKTPIWAILKSFTMVLSSVYYYFYIRHIDGGWQRSDRILGLFT